MLENLEESVWEFSKNFPKVTPFLIMRKFRVTFVKAKTLCQKVWDRKHLEARKMAQEIKPM